MLKMRISEGKKILESNEGVEIKNEKTRWGGTMNKKREKYYSEEE